jgi:hypothetical protein
MRPSLFAAIVIVSAAVPALAAAHPHDKDDAIESAVGIMEGNATRVRGTLQQARARGVAREITCASNALSRADASLRLGRDAARRRDAAQMAGLLASSRAALRSSEACIVHVLYAPAPAESGTLVRVFVDPSIAAFDP